MMGAGVSVSKAIPIEDTLAWEAWLAAVINAPRASCLDRFRRTHLPWVVGVDPDRFRRTVEEAVGVEAWAGLMGLYRLNGLEVVRRVLQEHRDTVLKNVALAVAEAEKTTRMEMELAERAAMLLGAMDAVNVVSEMKAILDEAQPGWASLVQASVEAANKRFLAERREAKAK